MLTLIVQQSCQGQISSLLTMNKRYSLPGLIDLVTPPQVCAPGASSQTRARCGCDPSQQGGSLEGRGSVQVAHTCYAKPIRMTQDWFFC